MPLKNVDEYNQEKKQQREDFNRKRSLTGVACPKCGNEMRWVHELSIINLATTVTTRPARCVPCSLTVDLEV